MRYLASLSLLAALAAPAHADDFCDPVTVAEMVKQSPDEVYPAEATSCARYWKRIVAGKTTTELLYVDLNNDGLVGKGDYLHVDVRREGQHLHFSDYGLDGFLLALDEERDSAEYAEGIPGLPKERERFQREDWYRVQVEYQHAICPDKPRKEKKKHQRSARRFG